MEWWQTLLLWSGGVFWGLVLLSTLLAIVAKRIHWLEIDSLDLEAEDEFDAEDYTLIYFEDGSRPPMRVPNDIAQDALDIMNEETIEQITEKVKPWTYTVGLGNIRAAQEIARQEPDPEAALMLWLANTIKLGR